MLLWKKRERRINCCASTKGSEEQGTKWEEEKEEEEKHKKYNEKYEMEEKERSINS
jgi:hypothetical protein